MIQNTYVLGAEELIELGQAALPAPTPPVDLAARTVIVSREEGELLVRVVENIVSFATDFPIEFHSHCPTDRWQKSLTQVGAWVQEIERQVKAGREQVTVPTEAVFRLVDLEKCVSAARDARLDAAKLAFALSAGGAVMDFVFGLSWVAMPMYIIGLGVLLGRPLLAKLNPEPQEPYKPFIAGAECKVVSGDHFRMGHHTDKKKVLERVILSPTPTLQKYHWGTVAPGFNGVESSICLAKSRFRVRIEGWQGDRVLPAPGWSNVPVIECEARKEIAVWSACGGRPPRTTPYGKPPASSGFKNNLWIEYVGPLTGGVCRTAGPFG